jgi:hypothetical protein
MTGAYSPLLEIALVLVRFDHVARIIVNANHSANRSVSLGRQGRLDYVNFGTYVPPHLSRCPKFF